jgi:hypothetical protein
MSLDSSDERIKNSPLAKVILPSRKIPPSSNPPISISSHKFIKQNLGLVSTFVLKRDGVSIERLCDILEDEICTLRALGAGYNDYVRSYVLKEENAK